MKHRDRLLRDIKERLRLERQPLVQPQEGYCQVIGEHAELTAAVRAMLNHFVGDPEFRNRFESYHRQVSLDLARIRPPWGVRANRHARRLHRVLLGTDPAS